LFLKVETFFKKFTNKILQRNIQGDHGGLEKLENQPFFFNWVAKAGKPVLFSDREAGKTGILNFRNIKIFLQLFF